MGFPQKPCYSCLGDRHPHRRGSNDIVSIDMEQNTKKASIGLALISILLWAMVAALGQKLKGIPPFLLLGITLGIGSLPSWYAFKSWFRNMKLLVWGTFCIFAYHALLFISQRLAPPVEANLINYTWPVFLVLLSTLLLPHHHFRLTHACGSILAFTGASLVLGANLETFRWEYALGYGFALGAALIWALYSVGLKKSSAFPTTTVGGFCLFSSILAFVCHHAFEKEISLTLGDLMTLTLIGLGPMGLAFYTWDASLKKGDPRMIGALSYLTPLLSTFFLAIWTTQGPLTGRIGLSLTLIVAGAIVSSWKSGIAR